METCFTRVLLAVIVSTIIGLNGGNIVYAGGDNTVSVTEKRVFKDSDGDTFEYEGSLKNNLPHGQGIATYSTGDKYVGEYKDGKQYGRGTMTWPNGDKYVGELKDDREAGGWYYWADGSKKWAYIDPNGEWVLK